MPEKQTPTVYSIEPYRGKPVVMRNGEPAPAYCYNYCHDLNHPGGREILRKFADRGCRVFMVPVRGGIGGEWGRTAFWTADNRFPEVPTERADEVSPSDMILYILEHAPDALFWIRFTGNPPQGFRDQNPDDLLLNSYGKRYSEPSLASDEYNRQLRIFVENVVGFCESRPWADRVAGYLSYPVGEGTTMLTNEGFLFDQSPVMQEGFRQYLRRKYGDDAELQRAWGREDVSLDEARVPTDQEFHERGRPDYARISQLGRQQEVTPRRLHWPDPRETAAEKDYCWFMRELTERNFRTMLGGVKKAGPRKLAGLDAFKQTMLGWPLMARSKGDYETHGGAMHPVSGAFAMAELLDLPDLDVVATPHDYLNRGMGFGYEGEGIGDSVVVRDKLMFMEEDQRTFSLPEGGRWNYLKDMDEVDAGLWRNLGASISRGYNTYPMDVCGASFFMDDGIQRVLAERSKVHEASVYWERREVPSIVMLVDDASVVDEDFTIGYQYLAVIKQRLYGLSRCGVPFRLHLVEDLEREDFPDCHRMFLLPNLFRITPHRLALLREKVFRNGNVVVFGPASGITDGRELSADASAELVGIPLELIRKESPRQVTVDRFDHPLTQNFDERVSYGDSLPYGPILAPQEHGEVKRLGGIQWPSARFGPGLVIREFGCGAAGNGRSGERGAGDYAAVFSCAVPLPPVLLRELARYSGTHIYGESDDLIFADSCSITIHSVVPGTRSIALPQPSTVWDVKKAECVGKDMKCIQVEVDPPQTDVFYLGDENPFEMG